MFASDSSALRDEHLIVERQILVAGRDACDVDKRISVSRVQWRTDSPVAALRMVAAGLGWAWLPSGFVRSALASGELVQIPAGNFTTALQLYVDVVWTQTRPLGLAARRFVELLDGRQGCSGAIAGDRTPTNTALSGSAPDPANPSAARPRAGKRRSSAASG
jgi:DNA-binding transcriptional LysR family regulator